MIIFLFINKKNIHSKLFCYLNIHKYYCCFFHMYAWCMGMSMNSESAAAFCMDRIHFSKKPKPIQEKNESENGQKGGEKMTTTATAAKQSFFIMMTITIILIAYAFLFVISPLCHIFLVSSILFNIWCFCFLSIRQSVREMRHTEKWNRKKRRFYENSTEENEIERHSSYGLHARIHVCTQTNMRSTIY